MKRKRFCLALAALLSTTSTSWALPFSATLTVPYTSAATLSLAGSGSSVDGAAGAFDLPAGVFTGAAGPVTTPAAAPALAAAGLRDIDSGPGSFAAGAGTLSLGGGLIHFFFQEDPDNEIPIPLTDVGVGGTTPISASLTGVPLTVTGSVTGAAWTTGAISVTGSSQTVMATGFDARMPGGTGAIRFVTPIEVDLDLGTGPFTFPGYAAVDFVFPPEPGSLLLVGSGLLGLLGIRRRYPRA